MTDDTDDQARPITPNTTRNPAVTAADTTSARSTGLGLARRASAESVVASDPAGSSPRK